MTDSKLIPVEAMVNQAIREEAFGDAEPVSTAQAMEEIAKVFGRPAKVAKTLIAERDTKAPKGAVDARSPATLSRAALSVLAASPESDEEAVSKALLRAGLTKEMIPQLMESPDWAGTMARLCQQYLVVTGLPKMVSAQITKASLGDTAAFKALMEAFGKSEMDSFDEQTRALAEASVETRTRATKALIEDLQRLVSEREGALSKPGAVDEARSKAIASLTERRDS